MYESESTHFVTHEACDACGSTDAKAVYSDGSTHCFSCKNTTQAEDGSYYTPKNPKSPKDFKPIQGSEITTTVRGIRPTTFSHWKYKKGEKGGKPVHICNFYEDGRLVGQKLRKNPKGFAWVKGSENPTLYGKWLWKPGGRKVVVTEGELDALSVSQVQGNKWPVVSISNGAQSAPDAFKENLEYLCSFDEVIIFFDNDDPGNEAAIEAAMTLPPGKAHIIRAPGEFKDANDMLKAGKSKQLQELIWNAQPYRPDGIVTLSDVIEKVLVPVEMGYSWPWQSLTDMTWGRRINESYYIGAGTGVGKTTFVNECVYHDAHMLKMKTGVIPLEQTPHKFFQRLAGLIGNKKFHKPPDGTWTPEDLTNALDQVQSENLFIYDSKGSADWDKVKDMIRYLALGLGCTSIYLDNLTGLRGEQGEKAMDFIDRVTRDIASLVLELPIMLTVVSHLATPEKGSHEEGARVKLREFKGSRSIGAWAHNAFGLERNQQDEDNKDVTTVRSLKDREMGEAVGKTIKLLYQHDTGRMVDFVEPEELIKDEDFF